MCIVYIYVKPLLQVHKNDVDYHGQYTESKLECLVKEGVYPPSIKCAVLYNSLRDFERPSLGTFHMTIAGTTKHDVSFPIDVYSAIGESKCRSMRRLHRQIQSYLCCAHVCHMLCCVVFVDCILCVWVGV